MLLIRNCIKALTCEAEEISREMEESQEEQRDLNVGARMPLVVLWLVL